MTSPQNIQAIAGLRIAFEGADAANTASDLKIAAENGGTHAVRELLASGNAPGASLVFDNP